MFGYAQRLGLPVSLVEIDARTAELPVQVSRQTDLDKRCEVGLVSMRATDMSVRAAVSR